MAGSGSCASVISRERRAVCQDAARISRPGPAANPDAETETLESAPICTEGAHSPMPPRRATSAGRRYSDVVGVAGTRVSQSTQIASRESPLTRRRRTPKRTTSRAPVKDGGNEGGHRGRQPRHAGRVAEYLRPCCINSEPRKMNEKKALKVKNAERLAATSVRFRSTAAGTSGWQGTALRRNEGGEQQTTTPKSSRVEAEVQRSRRRFRAYTSSSSSRSRCSRRRRRKCGRRAQRGRRRGTRGERDEQRCRSGTLMKNTYRSRGRGQEPLAITPTDAEVAPRRRRYRGRGAPDSEKVTARIESAEGATRAAPKPWSRGCDQELDRLGDAGERARRQ